MTIRSRVTCIAFVLILGASASASAKPVCDNRTGSQGGFFYTVWKSGGDACITLGRRGRYTSRYQLRAGENLVAGKGWRLGSTARTIGYRALRFDAGTNGYLALYGWSTDPLIEYYVVDNWGSAFTPPGGQARVLGQVVSDGGVYDVFRTQRVQQPSIRGTATFDQYWSVRQSRRATGERATITFRNHVAAWRSLGMKLGTMNYQVLATEGFGSTGGSDVTVWAE